MSYYLRMNGRKLLRLAYVAVVCGQLRLLFFFTYRTKHRR